MALGLSAVRTRRAVERAAVWDVVADGPASLELGELAAHGREAAERESTSFELAEYRCQGQAVNSDLGGNLRDLTSHGGVIILVRRWWFEPAWLGAQPAPLRVPPSASAFTAPFAK